MQTKHPCVLILIKYKVGEVCTINKPSSSFLTDRSKAVLLLLIIFVICVSRLSLSYCFVYCLMVDKQAKTSLSLEPISFKISFSNFS